MFSWRHIRMHFRGMGESDTMRRNDPLFDFTRPETNIIYVHIVSMLWSSMHTEKRGRKRHYGIAAQWSLLWGPNTLADYGFVSGYCCSLSVERRMNPSDFSNGISETPVEWAFVLIPLALSAVSRRIGPHAWSKGAALRVIKKEVPSAVPLSLFHSRWGVVAVLRELT